MRIGKEKKKREWEINFSSHAYVQQTEIDIDDNIQGKTVREKEKSEKCWEISSSCFIVEVDLTTIYVDYEWSERMKNDMTHEQTNDQSFD